MRGRRFDSHRKGERYAMQTLEHDRAAT